MVTQPVMFTEVVQKSPNSEFVHGPLNPVAPAKGHPITHSLAGRAHTKESRGCRTRVTGQLLTRIVRLLEEKGSRSLLWLPAEFI